ncbi:MAG TPA: hypothetical protein VND23_05800 [Acidimicrobiales bacterium]|nr:hypothetical protein [Acidimicrobiales bacterium]
MDATDGPARWQDRASVLEEGLVSGRVWVVGLSPPGADAGAPPSGPAALGHTVFVGGVPASVEVVYGDTSRSQSMLSVTTACLAPGHRAAPSIVELAEELARELPRAAAAAPVRLDDRPVYLADRPCRTVCQVADGDGRWALRLRAAVPWHGRLARRGEGGVALARIVEVTVVARGWEPTELRLDWLSSLRAPVASTTR